MKILSAAQMRRVDERTVEFGFAGRLELMEAAGTAVSECAQQLYRRAERFTVVCGKGNNGGDGLVAARKLSEAGKSVSVLLCSPPEKLSRDAYAMYERVCQCPMQITEFEKAPEMLAAADVIIDALLGTGAKPPLRGLYLIAVNAMNAAGKPIVSVDLPSGADADGNASELTVRASAVVTFTAPKRWHSYSEDADIPTGVADIGSPAEIVEEVAGTGTQLISVREFPQDLFARRMDSNKGLYGHVLVVGGSLGKAGAPAMSALAALRAGAGLATVASPGAVLNTVASFSPALMTEPLGGGEATCVNEAALDAVFAAMARKSVLAIGPGLGRAKETEAFVHAVVREAAIPLVLDADGLNAFEDMAKLFHERSGALLVITPHPGEMARLTGQSVAAIQRNREEVAKQFAQEHDCVVVLKGWRTVIAFASGEVWLNPTGNAAMAKGGTGDVLTGMVAALLAQLPEDPERAVLAAVYLHGLAGDVAARKFGVHGMLPEDLIAAIPRAAMLVERQRKEKYTWLHRAS